MTTMNPTTPTTRLIRYQRITITVLFWALLVTGLLYSTERLKVRAAREEAAAAVRDRMAQNATVDQLRRAIGDRDRRLRRYEAKYAPLPG
jgi:hypothetical protein